MKKQQEPNYSDFSESTLITPERRDGNCYRVHAKYYVTGDAKVVAIKLNPDDRERSLGGYKRKHSEKSEMDEVTLKKSYQRSRSRVTDQCIQKKLDQMLTLTTRENISEFDEFCKPFKLFLRNMRKRYGQRFCYVAVMEYQKRGAIHVHMGVSGFYMWNTVRKIWREALDHYGLGDGNVDFTKRRDKKEHSWNGKAIAQYIGKYITKTDIVEFNKKRYWSGGELPPLTKFMGFVALGVSPVRLLEQVIINLTGSPSRKRFEFDDRFSVTVLTT